MGVGKLGAASIEDAPVFVDGARGSIGADRAAAERVGNHQPVPCHNSHHGLSWYFLCPLGCSSVLVNQAIDDLPALDPGGHIDRFAGLVQRRSLLPRLVRPMLVAVPRVFGQSPPEMLFAVDQQAVEALAP